MQINTPTQTYQRSLLLPDLKTIKPWENIDITKEKIGFGEIQNICKIVIFINPNIVNN
jgi:hypothetical protein